MSIWVGKSSLKSPCPHSELARPEPVPAQKPVRLAQCYIQACLLARFSTELNPHSSYSQTNSCLKSGHLGARSKELRSVYFHLCVPTCFKYGTQEKKPLHKVSNIFVSPTIMGHSCPHLKWDHPAPQKSPLREGGGITEGRKNYLPHNSSTFSAPEVLSGPFLWGRSRGMGRLGRSITRRQWN